MTGEKHTNKKKENEKVITRTIFDRPFLYPSIFFLSVSSFTHPLQVVQQGLIGLRDVPHGVEAQRLMNLIPAYVVSTVEPDHTTSILCQPPFFVIYAIRVLRYRLSIRVKKGARMGSPPLVVDTPPLSMTHFGDF